jgi:hypothetical protein
MAITEGRDELVLAQNVGHLESNWHMIAHLVLHQDPNVLQANG